MSNVLTKDERMSIVEAAMAAKFTVRQQAFQHAKTQLADALYGLLVSPEEEAAVKALGSRWYETAETLYVNCDGFHNRGEGAGTDYRADMVDARLALSAERPLPTIHHDELTIAEGHVLWPITRVLVAERAAMLEERRTLYHQLISIVASARTRKQLLALWPEGEKFLPAETQRSMALVPIDAVKAVNAALGLP